MAFYYTQQYRNGKIKGHIWPAITTYNAACSDLTGSDCFWIVPGTVQP